MAYGYMLQGGLSEYDVIDQRILNGDDGNYLIPVQPATGYAESALTEPWACVTAAYEPEVSHRAESRAARRGSSAARQAVRGQASGTVYTISAGFDAALAPGAAAADARSGRRSRPGCASVRLPWASR